MELHELVKQIREFQTARQWSDNEVCKRFAGLGSTKTYKLILEGKTEGLDLERWSLEYSQVWALMELESSSGVTEEPVYDDFWHMTASRLATTDALAETGNNRLVIIEGAPGSGKTTAGRAIAARFGRRVCLAEADETWKGPRLNPMMGGLLHALKVQAPTSEEERKEKLLDTLRSAPVCLIIDEAHHLGLRTLNLVKTIINQTRCQVVFLCNPTLFRRLEMGAYEEARQLTQNRLCERVKLSGLPAKDVEEFLKRRLKWVDSDVKTCARELAERAVGNGNWNFVNMVVRKCARFADGAAVDKDVFVRALVAVTKTR